jgi:ubiquinone/menaquinone biosynthesis C-methylase UbiE
MFIIQSEALRAPTGRESRVAELQVSTPQKIWSLGNYHRLGLEHQIISEHLVDEATVRAGQKVLDLAAGAGNTTLAAARRRAHVTASDVVPEVLELARRRVEAEQVEGVSFHCADSVPRIDFPDGEFDAVLSTLGASFFPNHRQVVDELLRVTRPGGTIGIGLWSEASLPSDIFRAGQGVKQGATASDRIQPAYQLCNGEYLRELLDGRAATVRFVPGRFESCYETMDQYIDAHFTHHPPAILRLAAYDDAQKDEYRQLLAGIAQRYNRATNGTLAICMDYTLILISKRP